MHKKELTERIARAAHVSPGAAADQLDDAIHGFLKNLRRKEHPRPNALQRLIQEANCAPESRTAPLAVPEKGRHAKS